MRTFRRAQPGWYSFRLVAFGMYHGTSSLCCRFSLGLLFSRLVWRVRTWFWEHPESKTMYWQYWPRPHGHFWVGRSPIFQLIEGVALTSILIQGQVPTAVNKYRWSDIQEHLEHNLLFNVLAYISPKCRVEMRRAEMLRGWVYVLVISIRWTIFAWTLG